MSNYEYFAGHTVVSALNAAARQCGIKSPSSWVTATRDDHVALRDDFLRETVEDILERIDLPQPVANTQILTAGTGTPASDGISTGAVTWRLNADMYRLQRGDHAVCDLSQDRPLIPVVTDGDWLRILDQGIGGPEIYFQVRGFPSDYELWVYPDTEVDIAVHYISTKWIRRGVISGRETTPAFEFKFDDDILAIPRRPVEVGMVWRWRERQGLPYQDKLMEYEGLLARLSNERRRRTVVNMGGRNTIRWQDLVPSFIPPT